MRRFVLSAVLCLPLSVFSQSSLQRLFASVTGLPVSCPDREHTRAMLGLTENVGSGFDNSLDDGDVPPNVAEELLAELDNRDDLGIDENDDVAAAHFTDGGGRLRRLVYGEEHFSVRARDDGRIVTDEAGGLAVRRHFDGENRLTAQERFSIGASSRDLQLLSTRTYAYHDGVSLPYQMTEETADDERRIVTDYDEDGSAIGREISHYEHPHSDDSRYADDPPKLVRDKKIVWAYDDERRLIAEETTDYHYGKTATGREKVETEVIKRFYDYDGAGGAKPDISYYENEKLRMRTVYERENVYTETMYFDGDFVVQARYEDGAKVQEIVSAGGTEVRRRNFAH